MLDFNEVVKERINERHGDDESQLKVIYSNQKRALIEAPAGYGKTKTMVSKVTYLLATRQIPNPKKLLALTFSVNAAYKIKKDISNEIPNLLSGTEYKIKVNEKIFVSNYHGFCRNVLKKHGHLLSESLLDIDSFETIADYELKKIGSDLIAQKDIDFLIQYSNSVSNVQKQNVAQNIEKYCDILIENLLPQKIITYNAILTLTIKLLRENPAIKRFYNNFFTTIIVDEYQDTNLLSYWLLTQLVNDKTRIILFGDTLQRIYGFIGAIPDLFEMSKEKFNIELFSLKQNHRFSTNQNMLILDKNIRRNAENPYLPLIEERAMLNFKYFSTQNEEALELIQKTLSLTANNPNSQIAVLVKQKRNNASLEQILKGFDENKIPYYYGLFTDEDPSYINFHRSCLKEFQELAKDAKFISKKLALEHKTKISQLFDTTDKLSNSLLILLDVFWGKFFENYLFLHHEDKITFIKETFEHNSLKQYMGFINAKIIFATVHAAKGLEWEYVILPDMEQDLFPNWSGLCKTCSKKLTCQFTINQENEGQFLEELSVFYVAVTRAKRQVYFSASATQPDRYGRQREKNISCFLKLPGFHIENN